MAAGAGRTKRIHQRAPFAASKVKKKKKKYKKKKEHEKWFFKKEKIIRKRPTVASTCGRTNKRPPPITKANKTHQQQQIKEMPFFSIFSFRFLESSTPSEIGDSGTLSNRRSIEIETGTRKLGLIRLTGRLLPLCLLIVNLKRKTRILIFFSSETFDIAFEIPPSPPPRSLSQRPKANQTSRWKNK